MTSSVKHQNLVLDIYARVSRAGDERQRSTEGQIDDCTARIAEHGAEVGEVHVDSGRSAWNPSVRRPDWNRLMDRLESGAAGGVVVFDLERFSRRPIEGERLIVAAERGLVVLDSEGEYDLTTAGGKKSFREHLVSAAYYSDRLSTKVRRGKRLKAMKGESNASWRGFGFPGKDVKTGDPVPAEQVDFERGVLRDLVRRLLVGESCKALVRELNARGVVTSTGGSWTRAGLTKLILRPANAGLVTYGGEIVSRISGEPIISEEDYERVYALFASRRRGRPPCEQYLLSGVVWCGRCGTRTLNGRLKSDYRKTADGQVQRSSRRIYECLRRPGSTSGCGRLTVDQQALDDHVRELALTLLSDPEHAMSIAARSEELADERARLTADIADIEETLVELAGRLGRQEMTLKRHDAAADPLNRTLARLEEERDALDAHQGDVPATASVMDLTGSRAEWEARWEAANTDEKRVLVRRALGGRRLVVLPFDPRGPRRFDPNRVRIETATEPFRRHITTSGRVH